MAADENLTYSMYLEVYLQSAMVRGLLETNQDRLSNHMIVRQGEEVFSLKEATLEILNRQPIKVSTNKYLLYMQEVLLIADLSVERRAPSPGLHSLLVKKDQSKALLSVGPYLLHGTVHLQAGSDLQDLLMAQSRFLPVTEATLIDRQDALPCTYLINRTKIGFISAVADGVTEF